MLQSVSPKHDLPLKPEGQAAKPERTGTWAPFSIQAFRIIWICNLFANLGTWAQSVAAAWVVTDAHASPLMVAMIQVAAALPLVLLSILSGVIADNHDRRKIMLWGLSFEMTGAMFATLLAFLGYLDPVLLIISILWISLGGSVTIPAWQAAVNEQVPARMVSDAVLLNSVNYNVARAAGPALGGLLLSAVGPAWVFLFNSFCYMALIWAIWQWRRDVPKRSLPPEGILEGVTAALRFTQYSTVTRLVMMRSFAFGLSASAVWALLPLVARQMLGGSSGFYGVLLGAVGAGAIIGALVMPKLGAKLNADGLVLLASVVSAVVMGVLVFAPPKWLAVLMLVLLGMGWITALTTFNGVAQAILPNWVRGRGLAVYLMVFNGAMAAGSLGWGLVAREIGVPYALVVSAVGLVAVALLFHRARLPVGEADLQASNHWPEPLVSAPVANDRGPVLIQVEYRVRQADRPAFLEAMQRLSQERLRDGAYAWGVVEHTGDPERVMEWFFVESWAEHLRQHHRVSHADADLQAEALRFHIGPDKPEVHHFLALKR